MALDSAVSREIMTRLVGVITEDGPVSLTKAELLTAVNALDTFLAANAAAVNAAIPEPARTALTTPQKAAMLAYVALARFGG